MTRRQAVHLAGALCVLGALCLRPECAHAQPAAPAPAAWRWSLTNTTRLESWRFFEPPPSGGDPDYAFLANRLRVALTRAWPRVDVTAATQYVQFGGLPAHASGPGPFGTGALYYDHSGRADSRGVYVPALNLRVRLPAGFTLQAGRFAYQSGAESSSGRARIEMIKRMRVDGRLVGEFEWSLFQRSFDGVRGDMDRRQWHLTGAWFSPTQGGFEDAAGTRMPGIKVVALTLGIRPSVVFPATDVSVFGLRYDDDRRVSARPDNTGLQADRVALGLTTFGASAVGSAPTSGGDADWVLWLAAQGGSWYGLTHRAWSLALEGGHQWSVRWQPWIRGGVLFASGDKDGRDSRHGTFFPMLPTVRKYSFTASYTPMNLRDVFVEVISRPARRLLVRADVRHLRLMRASDLWYAGSGATQQRGRTFGYAGRPSGAAADLGTVVEAGADLAVMPHWTVNGFYGVIKGGRVVRSLFAGDRLTFAYLESVIAF